MIHYLLVRGQTDMFSSTVTFERNLGTSVGMCKQRVCFCELVFTFYDNAEHTFVHFFDMCRVLNFLDGGQVQMCKVSTLNLRQVQTLR